MRLESLYLPIGSALFVLVVVLLAAGIVRIRADRRAPADTDHVAWITGLRPDPTAGRHGGGRRAGSSTRNGPSCTPRPTRLLADDTKDAR